MSDANAPDNAPAPKKGCCYRCKRNWPLWHIFSFLFIFSGAVTVLTQIDGITLGLKTLGLDFTDHKMNLIVCASIVMVVDVFVILVAFSTTPRCREKCCGKTNNCCCQLMQCLLGQLVQIIFFWAVLIGVILTWVLTVSTAATTVIAAMADGSCDVSVELEGNSTFQGADLMGILVESAKSNILPAVPEGFSGIVVNTTGSIVCGDDPSYIYFSGNPGWKYDPGEDFMHYSRTAFIGSSVTLFGQVLLLCCVVNAFTNLSWQQYTPADKKQNGATPASPPEKQPSNVEKQPSDIEKQPSDIPMTPQKQPSNIENPDSPGPATPGPATPGPANEEEQPLV